jgi:chromosome segregation ATPase
MMLQNNEEIQNLQKRITHLQADVETANSQLTETTEKLEERNKTLANVRLFLCLRVPGVDQNQDVTLTR